ncbi:MAG: Lrp/AsnC family transcriptional regulator [Coriobacteriia bacterium]
MHELDPSARRLLAALEGGLPVSARPFADVGSPIGMTGAEVVATLRSLRDTRVIRRVGAEVSPTALGYRASLGAMAIPEDTLDEAIDVLDDVPGITHAFEMDDRYRLWFVMVAPSPARLEIAESEFARSLGAADRFRVLPTEEYRVAHAFDADGTPESFVPAAATHALDADARALVRLLQGDMPLEERPFAALASTLAECGFDADEQQVLDDTRALVTSGVVRRIAAITRDRHEPWRLALATWVNPHHPAEAGSLVAAFPEVIHCFDRRVPGGGKAIVAVVETPDRTSLDRTIERIRTGADLDAPRIAYPLRELKRSSMRYFSAAE